MQNTTERRQLILEYISDNRHVQIQNIVDEFHISRRTAVNDIQILQCSYPIYAQQGGGGGVFAMEGWYLSRRYLHDDQEALLRKLMDGLQPDEQQTMQRILTAFAKPHKEDKH